jgi:hypothetical protein
VLLTGEGTGAFANSNRTSGFLGLLSTDGSVIFNVDSLGHSTCFGGGAFIDNITVASAPASDADPVPEPASILGTLGTLGFMAFGRHRRRNRS